MTSSEILLRAADLIENGGLVKKIYRKGESFCVIGACRFAVSKSVLIHDKNVMELDRYFDKIVGFPRISIATWNDAPERTADEVVAKLREAATWTDDDLHM